MDLVEEGTYSVKVPDAHLINRRSGKLVIALEVGFSESLDH